jgi:glutamine synthetase
MFEGNNYSDDWAKEAKKRGLSNLKTTPDALKCLITKEAEAVLVKPGIFSTVELHARYEIELEKYVKKIQIESRLLGELCLGSVIPPSNRYLGELAETYGELKDCGIKNELLKAHKELITEIAEHINFIKLNVGKMIDARKKANALTDMVKMAKQYCDEVKPYFDTIRYHADKLETLVDDSYWQLPKYRELLFIR